MASWIKEYKQGVCKLIGLCHICYSSGVDVHPVEGLPTCKTCKGERNNDRE